MDDSVRYIENNHPKVQIIKLEKNYGYAEPNNIAAKQAKGDLLFFLNNETILCENSISELVKYLQESDASICQSLLLDNDENVDSSGDFMITNGISYNSKDRCVSIKPILSARGAAMMVKKEIFWKLGGFDSKFFISFEDVDFGWRAWIFGYKVALVPKSIVYHLGGQTTKKLESMVKFHGAKNTIILCLANFEFLNSIKSLLLLTKLVFQKKIFGKNSKISDSSLQIPSIGLTFKVIFWVLKNVNYINQKRANVSSKRILSTKELIQTGLLTTC